MGSLERAITLWPCAHVYPERLQQLQTRLLRPPKYRRDGKSLLDAKLFKFSTNWRLETARTPDVIRSSMSSKPHAMPAPVCALCRAPALPMEEPLDAPRDDPQSFNGSGWLATSPTSLSSTPSTRSPSFPTPAAPTRSLPRHVIRSGRVRLARRRSADQHFQKGSHHEQIAAGRDSQPDQPQLPPSGSGWIRGGATYCSPSTSQSPSACSAPISSCSP
jgi:hypothetical protein